MAQKVQITMTCDLESSEKPAQETLTFALDGATYEIDVCDKHAKQFRDVLASFVSAGRRVSSRAGGRRRRGGGSSDRERTQEIRAWARSKGIKVSERGRLSGDIVAKYEASGGR
ncbi:MAG TPA: Lsr2 family protein [Frankiaceae bacterium]|nr:Lsr2 family protein [Frankiaceae bacterium]